MHDDRPVRVTGIYTQPYNEIVRPERVWKISKYFLRRWTPYLSPNEVWLVIGARQLSYFNERRPWFQAYDRTLAEAAGLHVKVFRRTIKKGICNDQGYISAFLSKTADPQYRRVEGVTRQTQTRYSIRLDDPLTPGDATALAYWLRRHSPPRVTPENITTLLEEGLALQPQELRAAQRAPITPEKPDLHAVADVVTHVFANALEDDGWREAADKLHTHIVCPELAHFETQYFRRRWAPQLGAGPALLLSYLRSLCYHNEESGEIRDEVRIQSGHLEDLFQVSSRTLRRWFAHLDEATGDDPLQEPLLKTLEAVKQPDQKVLTTYWINLRTPLLAADLPAYRQALRRQEDVTGNVTDKKFPTLGVTPYAGGGQEVPHTSQGSGQKVPHEEGGDGQDVAHTARGKRQKAPHTRTGDGQEVPHTSQGDGQTVPHDKEGDGQKIPGWGTDKGSYKYYKILSEASGHNSVEDLWTQIPEQEQDSWRLDGGARQPFAVAVCDHSMPRLLDRLGVQDPARTEILTGHAAAEEIVAWLLYAYQQEGLERPLSYVIHRLRQGDPPPLYTLQLASLSWEQWRTYAWAWHAQPLLGRRFDRFVHLPLFDQWGDLYAGAPLDELPFDVGLGLDHLLANPHQPARGEDVEAEQQPEEAGVWRDVLEELALQMTRATFDAWLRDTCLVGVDQGRYVVAVSKPEAQAWLQNRLQATVERTVQALTEGRVSAVTFVVDGP